MTIVWRTTDKKIDRDDFVREFLRTCFNPENLYISCRYFDERDNRRYSGGGCDRPLTNDSNHELYKCPAAGHSRIALSNPSRIYRSVLVKEVELLPGHIAVYVVTTDPDRDDYRKIYEEKQKIRKIVFRAPRFITGKEILYSCACDGFDHPATIETNEDREWESLRFCREDSGDRMDTVKEFMCRIAEQMGLLERRPRTNPQYTGGGIGC